MIEREFQSGVYAFETNKTGFLAQCDTPADLDRYRKQLPAAIVRPYLVGNRILSWADCDDQRG